MTDTLESLVARVAELEAESEIRRLLVRYAESLDYGDNVAWADTFIPDGYFDVRRRGVEMFAHKGTEALQAFGAQHTHAPNVYHKHFLSIPTIEFDGADKATARAYFTMLYERTEGPFVLVFGRYLDDLVKTDQGWKFATRVVDMEALAEPVVPVGESAA
jgi:3-phenylpropionate/cinnamic acid dioxygenase small subunit